MKNTGFLRSVFSLSFIMAVIFFVIACGRDNGKYL